MPSLTIRLRSDGDRAAVERLKAATRQATASGAILRAAREWPALIEALRTERHRTAELSAALDAILEAEANFDRARAHRVSVIEAARPHGGS